MPCIVPPTRSGCPPDVIRQHSLTRPPTDSRALGGFVSRPDSSRRGRRRVCAAQRRQAAALVLGPRHRVHHLLQRVPALHRPVHVRSAPPEPGMAGSLLTPTRNRPPSLCRCLQRVLPLQVPRVPAGHARIHAVHGLARRVPASQLGHGAALLSHRMGYAPLCPPRPFNPPTNTAHLAGAHAAGVGAVFATVGFAVLGTTTVNPFFPLVYMAAAPRTWKVVQCAKSAAVSPPCLRRFCSEWRTRRWHARSGRWWPCWSRRSASAPHSECTRIAVPIPRTGPNDSRPRLESRPPARSSGCTQLASGPESVSDGGLPAVGRCL